MERKISEEKLGKLIVFLKNSFFFFFFRYDIQKFSSPVPLAEANPRSVLNSTATYCAEIFFPFGKSNFKGQRSRLTRRKRDARRWRRAQSMSLPADETMHLADAPARCVYFINEKYRWQTGLNAGFEYLRPRKFCLICAVNDETYIVIFRRPTIR